MWDRIYKWTKLTSSYCLLRGRKLYSRLFFLFLKQLFMLLPSNPSENSSCSKKQMTQQKRSSKLKIYNYDLLKRHEEVFTLIYFTHTLSLSVPLSSLYFSPFFLSLSLSLSLYIYIYIYIYVVPSICFQTFLYRHSKLS